MNLDYMLTVISYLVMTISSYIVLVSLCSTGKQSQLSLNDNECVTKGLILGVALLVLFGLSLALPVIVKAATIYIQVNEAASQLSLANGSSLP